MNDAALCLIFYEDQTVHALTLLRSQKNESESGKPPNTAVNKDLQIRLLKSSASICCRHCIVFIECTMSFQNQRDRLSDELNRFKDQLQKALSDYERERLQATIRGTEMMLAVIPKAEAAE